MKFIKYFACLLMIISFPSHSGDEVLEDKYREKPSSVGKSDLSLSKKRRFHEEVELKESKKEFKKDEEEPEIILEKVWESPDQIKITPDMIKRLAYKADKLTKALGNLEESLKKVKEDLGGIARQALQRDDYVTIAEIATHGSNIAILTSSAARLLTNLEGKKYESEKDLTSISLSVIASGAFKDQLNNFITHLRTHEATSHIDCGALEEIIETLNKVNKGILTEWPS